MTRPYLAGPPVPPERLARLEVLMRGWFECRNELCDRVVRRLGMHCCGGCRMAGGDNPRGVVYEIHETGPLSHGDGCDGKWAARLAGERP